MIWKMRTLFTMLRSGEVREAGQILVMFALVSTAMFGVLGLATDLGISFAGRRTVQTAADAAAMAGARSIAMSVTSPTITASTEVNALTAANTFSFASSGPSVESCQYVNDSNTTLGACSGTVPSTATGVKVTVAETHPTYFIRVVPGAPSSSTTRATAIAHVMKPTLTGSGPFIVCATDTIRTSGLPKTKSILLQVNGIWQINPAAVGDTFNIHDPQANGTNQKLNKCGNQDSSFKGVADQDKNKSYSAPPAQYFYYSTGQISSISATVQGINGCQAGQPLNNCVAYLPISVIDPAHPAPGTSSDPRMWVIGFAAFLITDSGNGHTGKLLDNYIVKGPASYGWTPAYFGPVSIKLTD